MMNKNIFWILVITFLFSSCGKKYTDHPFILQAEKLMNTKPELSYNLLVSVDKPQNLSHSDYAAWCLHYTYALNKLDTLITSDSLIRIPIKYYEGTSMYLYSGMSYYLLGCIFENRNEKDDAMHALKQAESKLLKTKAYSLLGLLYYKMGYLYSLDEVYNNSNLCFKQSQRYFHLAKNTRNEAYAFRELANSSNNLNGNINTILHYFHHAQLLSLQSGDIPNYHDVSCSLAITLLNKTHEYQMAKQYLLAAYKFDNYSPYYYNKLSIAYSRLNKPDSALFFFNKALPDTVSIYNKTASYMAGAFAEKANGNYAKALDYFLQYDANRNKVISETKRSQLYRIDKSYDVNQKNRENAELKITNRNMIIYITILLVMVLLVVVEMLVFRLNRKKEQALLQLERQARLSKIDKKRLLLLSKLESRIDNTLFFQNHRAKLIANNSLHSNVMDEMLKRSILNENEWQEYIDEVNLIFNNRLDNIAHRSPLITAPDKIVMALISVQIDITNACTLLGTNKNTMYKRRNTIKERLELDKSVDLELWLLEHVALKIKEVPLPERETVLY